MCARGVCVCVCVCAQTVRPPEEEPPLHLPAHPPARPPTLSSERDHGKEEEVHCGAGGVPCPCQGVVGQRVAC